MASAFFGPDARPDSGAASREGIISFAAVSVNPSSTIRWTPNELAVSVTQAHSTCRKNADQACSPAAGSVPCVADKSRARSTFVPGCVLRRPAAMFSKQTPSVPDTRRIVHVPGAHPAVSTASRQVAAPPAPQQHRRPLLQLPAALPNGIPLRRTTSSCFEHYKILEAVGAGTYANVWKVQRLPVPPFHSSVQVTLCGLGASRRGIDGLAHVSDSHYQGNCTSTFPVAEERDSAFATVLLRKTPAKHGLSNAFVQKASQQQPTACNSTSSIVVNSRISSGTSPGFKGGHVRSSRGPAEGQIYAAKLLQLDRFSPDTLPRVLDMFRKEILNLAACQCPGVVGLHEVVEGKEGWLLVQDFIDGGTIWSEDVCRDEDEAFLHFIQVLQAVLYLQENSILHRDLKPTNILRSKQTGRVVIADFGWSERLDCCRITPMEWPGTLEINPPEIINGTGPLTERLDNYAVGMTLLLFLSGRFVCRQKGLDAATAAPYVLRTVHELRQGPPPAVFKGSVDAWTLFVGLTAPHPSRRWSLDHVLAHTWVQQKLLRLRKRAFVWHPRVLQLATLLQRAYGHSLYMGDPGNLHSNRLHAARAVSSATPACRRSFESAVKALPAGDGAAEAVMWTPNNHLAGTVSNACATTHTLHSGREPLTTAAATWTAAGAATAVETRGGSCGNSSCATGTYCEQCCRVSGLFPRERQAVRHEKDAQVTHPAREQHNLSPLNNSRVTSSRPIPPSPSPCTPQHVPLKGLYTERGSSSSRRQSLSICSTTDSFVTNLSFQQQQQASQQTARGHLCVQTASSPLTPKSHEDAAAADGADWQVLVSRSTAKKTTGSLDVIAPHDRSQTNSLQRSKTYASNEKPFSAERHLRRQHGCRRLGMDAFHPQLHCNVGELRDKPQGSRVLETRGPSPFAIESGSCQRFHDFFTPVPQLLLRYGEPQTGSLTSLQQQRPLPWRLLLPGLVGGGDAGSQGEVKGADAGLRATEHSNTVPPLRDGCRAVCYREALFPPTRSSAHESQDASAASESHRREHSIGNNHAVPSDPAHPSLVHCTVLDNPDNSRILSAASGKARLLRSHPYTRQQGISAHPYARNDASHGTAFTPPGGAKVVPLDETSLEDEDVDTGGTVLHPCEVLPHTGALIAEEDNAENMKLKTSKNALERGRVATLLSPSAGATSAESQPFVRRISEHTWRPEVAALWNPHLTSNTCDTPDYSRHNISTVSTSTLCTANSLGQMVAFTRRCSARDSDAITCSSTKLALQHGQQHVLLRPASIPAENTAYRAFLKPSSATLSFPVVASQDCAVSSSVAAVHRSASSRSHHRRWKASLTPAHGRSDTLLTVDESKGNLVHSEISQKLPNAALPPSPEGCTVLTTHEEERVDRFSTYVARGRHGVPVAGSEADVLILSRTHAMRRLPSQLSTLSSESGYESAAVPPRRRSSTEEAAADGSPGEMLPARRLHLPSFQLHALQTVGCVTEEVRQRHRDSLSSPAATFLAASSTTDGTVSVEPLRVAAAFHRDNKETSAGCTPQESASSNTPNVLVKLDTASQAGVCSVALGEEERGSTLDEQLCSTDGENATAVSSQLLKAASGDVPPAAQEGSPSPLLSRVAQETATAHINPSSSPAGGMSEDGTQADGSQTEQAEQKEQRHLTESPNCSGIPEEKVQYFLSDDQYQSDTRASSASGNNKDQSVNAPCATERAAAFHRCGDCKGEKASFSWEGKEDMPRSYEVQIQLCKQYPTGAARRIPAAKGGTDTPTELQIEKVEISSKLEDAVGPPRPQQVKSHAVKSVDVSPCANVEDKSTILSGLPGIAGCIQHCACSSLDTRQVAQSGRVRCSGFSLDPAEGGDTSDLHGNHAVRRNNMKVTGRIEFYDKRRSPPSSPLPSSSSDTEGRLEGCRGQTLLPGTRVDRLDRRAEGRAHQSSNSGKSCSPDANGRPPIGLLTGEDVVTVETATSPQRSPGVRKSDVPSRHSAQQSAGSCTKSSSQVAPPLRSECITEPHATREAAEASGTRRVTATVSDLAATAEMNYVGLRREGTENSVTFTPVVETNAKLGENIENLVYSTMRNACRQGAVGPYAASVYSPDAVLRCKDYRNWQPPEECLFDHAALMGSARKIRKNDQDEKPVALPWQRPASFPTTLTTSCTRMTYHVTTHDETLLSGPKDPLRKPRSSPHALLGKRYDDNGSAAVSPFKFNSEPVTNQSHRST